MKEKCLHTFNHDPEVEPCQRPPRHLGLHRDHVYARSATKHWGDNESTPPKGQK